MKDVNHSKSRAVDFEIKPQVARTKSVEGLSAALKTAQRFAGFVEITRLQATDGLDGRQLGEGVEFLKLREGLFGKGDLEHEGSGEAGGRRKTAASSSEKEQKKRTGTGTLGCGGPAAMLFQTVVLG